MLAKKYVIHWLVCILGVMVASCSTPTSSKYATDLASNKIRITVVNKGPEVLYQVKVTIADNECKLGSFAPGLYATKPISPTVNSIGKSFPTRVEFEDEAGDSLILDSHNEVQVSPGSEIRIEIGQRRILDVKTIRGSAQDHAHIGDT
jgi:hypothetical protein